MTLVLNNSMCKKIHILVAQNEPHTKQMGVKNIV